MNYLRGGLIAVMALLTACQPTNRFADSEDERNPNFKKAQQDMDARDYVAAVRDYEDALQASPNVARAHYELGLIYGEKLGDQISAMYHFRKFLALRPDSPIVKTVEARLESAKITFAANLANTPLQDSEVFLKLQNDNRTLQQNLDLATHRVTELESSIAAGTPPPVVKIAAVTPPTTNAPPAVAPSVAVKGASPTVSVNTPPVVAVAHKVEPAAPAPSGRQYTIAAGDNLWRIATKFYPGKANEGIDKIKAANPEFAKDPRKLKPGTVLSIP